MKLGWVKVSMLIVSTRTFAFGNRWLGVGLLVLASACAPATSTTEPQPVVDVTYASGNTFKALLNPFQSDLANLGVKRIDKYQAYNYVGNDESGFIQAINQFYQRYPGFCPLLDNGFFPAQNGVVFMTLASNNSIQLRGFLYDQSRKPKLTYAYFEATGESPFSSIACKTAAISN
jgi:hypothetical protein